MKVNIISLKTPSMKSTRFLFSALSLAAVLALSGCGLSTVDYNNEVVDHLNPTLDAMEATLDTYEVAVPMTVYDDSIIDAASMETVYSAAKTQIDFISSDLLLLESANEDQQVAVRAGLTTYQASANEFLALYREMLDYYLGDFATDLDKVAEYDADLYDVYNEYIDMHNALVDTLASYT